MKKSIKKSLALFLALVLLLGAAPMGKIDFSVPATAATAIPLTADVTPVSGGSYTIANAEQLKRLSDIVKSGNECEGATFTMTADIVLNAGELTADENGEPLYNGNPVSAANQPEKWFPIGYRYDLDGNGTQEVISFCGIFDGNFHTVSGLFFNNSMQTCVGLFGQVSRSNAQIKNVGVINCYIRGNKMVGGVCGYNEYGSKITNCYNTGSVSGTGYSIGGVCGYNEGTITNCYNTGSVSGGSRVGGVCGENSGTITSSYNTGVVSGNDSVGGVCGRSTVTMTKCYNTGSVSGMISKIGGVCGSNIGIIEICYNTGKVSGGDNAGGICGHNDSKIACCYSTGFVSSDGDVIGGICAANSSNGTISSCYNIGKLKGLELHTVGGVCGENDRGTIASCYYLEGCCIDTFNYTISKTAVEMKDSSFITLLNGDGSAFIPSFSSEMNSGYPLLKAFITLEGEGTEESPYLIYNANHLNNMSYLVNYQNTDYGDKHYKLMADIAFNGGELSADTNGEPLYSNIAVSADNMPNKWLPIGYHIGAVGGSGNEDSYFKGVFDGNGHTVSGIFIDDTSAIHVGLFGQISIGAEIKNVSVVNSYIRCFANTGGICGENGNGTITNCNSSTVIIAARGTVGGICGYNNGTITNCSNIGFVNGNSVVGGVCGTNIGKVKNCLNIGAISGNIGIGGICGANNGEITDCFNAGNVIGKGDYVGGACGANEAGTVTGVYYLNTCGAGGSLGTSKTEVQFNSGEVCSLLNSGKADGAQAFYQNLGTNADKYPTLDNTHGTVYSGYNNSCIISYANTILSSTPTHSYGPWTVATSATCAAKGNERRDCEYCDEFETREIAILTMPTVAIKNRNTVTSLKYGDTLKLTATATNLPEGAYIKWTIKGEGITIVSQDKTDGTCVVKSDANGSVTITATAVYENGTAITDSLNNGASALQTITSKAGFFQKLIYFFKNLFGSIKPIVQSINKIG